MKACDGLNPFQLHCKASNGDAMKGFDLFVECLVEKRNLSTEIASASEQLDVEMPSSTMAKFIKPVSIQTFMARD